MLSIYFDMLSNYFDMLSIYFDMLSTDRGNNAIVFLIYD